MTASHARSQLRHRPKTCLKSVDISGTLSSAPFFNCQFTEFENICERKVRSPRYPGFVFSSFRMASAMSHVTKSILPPKDARVQMFQ